MLELSVFIDESGDFGPYAPHAPYYIITLVFHEQTRSIHDQVSHLRQAVRHAGFDEQHAIHSAPLIRKERDYRDLDRTERRRLFRALFTFIRLSDISYSSFVFNKREFSSHDQLLSRISREVGMFLKDHLAHLQSFEKIIVYYDNGQKEITNLVNTLFNAFLEAEVRKVKPSDYALFQAADMLCTLTLLNEKVCSATLSESETVFFKGVRNLKKNYLKPIERKLLK